MKKANNSAEEQIENITTEITKLISFLQTDKNNELNRRKLLILVGKRRMYLNYLKKNKTKDYFKIIKKLNIVG